MTADRIRTTHIGSLPRSPDLLELLKRRQAGETVDEEEWHDRVREATASVIERQADIGLDIVNNGEQPRVSFNWYVANRLTGIGDTRDAPLWDDLADYPEYAEDAFEAEGIDLTKQPSVTGPVEYAGEEAAREEIDTFVELLDAADADFEGTFLTAASPGIAAATLVNDYYDSHEEFLSVVGDALKREYELIAETGATLQLDAPDLLTTGHRGFGDRPIEKLKPIVRMHVEALNEATADIPDEQLRVHTCWGSYEGPHHRDKPLEEILPILYDLDVGGLSIEEANPRHQHEYRVFREHPLPDGWTLIPGVVDVKTNIVEHPEVVADRLERVAGAVDDPTRIVAAPDCGFDTQAGLAMVHPEIAWAKLETLVEGAEVATERLFG
ncbi:cobalamin-independent methionine synthase II family protein [Halobellus ordinarius]|uniref:cobalamin-independent methionine synthase II family protein n=1 Tax=Halobellus ordinarius TaxID=3075120 RepID=UPI00288035EA|nr:cobalamin-independent methionine synthase II family protein [Halobellus sp. ZY16]